MKITANKWFGPDGVYAGRGPFRSPQSFLKEAVGAIVTGKQIGRAHV